jgi:hypothetical protein
MLKKIQMLLLKRLSRKALKKLIKKKKLKSTNCMRKICIFLLVLFCGFVSKAQVKEKSGYNKQVFWKIQIKDPKSILLLIRMIPLQIGIFIPIQLMVFH